MAPECPATILLSGFLRPLPASPAPVQVPGHPRSPQLLAAVTPAQPGARDHRSRQEREVWPTGHAAQSPKATGPVARVAASSGVPGPPPGMR